MLYSLLFEAANGGLTNIAALSGACSDALSRKAVHGSPRTIVLLYAMEVYVALLGLAPGRARLVLGHSVEGGGVHHMGSEAVALQVTDGNDVRIL